MGINAPGVFISHFLVIKALGVFVELLQAIKERQNKAPMFTYYINFIP